MTRRGRKRKGSCGKSENLSLLGSNANGIKSKMESLLSNISTFKPTILTIQETKLSRRSLVKLKGYQIFETPRAGKIGGGLLTAIDENLDSVEIMAHEDTLYDILTIQFKIRDLQVRVINAHGPQEDESAVDILQFWLKIEEEVEAAKDNNCLVIMQLDANAKVGNTVIKNDPHNKSGNGVLFLDLVRRQNLFLANASSRCQGVITRVRKLFRESKNLSLTTLLSVNR